MADNKWTQFLEKSTEESNYTFPVKKRSRDKENDNGGTHDNKRTDLRSNDEKYSLFTLEKTETITPQKLSLMKEFSPSKELFNLFCQLRNCHKRLEKDEFVDILKEMKEYDDTMYIKYIKDYLKDCNTISKVQQKEESLDPKWREIIKNTILGKLVETLYHTNMTCPVCKKDLLQYSADNFPVYDFVCSSIRDSHIVNDKDSNKHKNYSKFFQVKCKFDNSNYFCKNEKYFTPSSSALSKICHSISPQSTDTEKLQAVNYILLAYNHTDDNIITFNNKDSCIIMPDLSKSTGAYYTENDDSIQYYNKPTYRWSDNCTVYDFHKEKPRDNGVKLDDALITIDFDRSLEQKLNFKRKYIKYKTKYIALKYFNG